MILKLHYVEAVDLYFRVIKVYGIWSLNKLNSSSVCIDGHWPPRLSALRFSGPLLHLLPLVSCHLPAALEMLKILLEGTKEACLLCLPPNICGFSVPAVAAWDQFHQAFLL